jgi:hypothetical protein
VETPSAMTATADPTAIPSIRVRDGEVVGRFIEELPPN